MTITYPLSTASFADLISFDAGSRLWLPHDHQELSNLASGGTIAKDLRQRLWQADVQTVALSTDDYTTLESVLDSLDGATYTFYLYDPKRQYPKADPTGSTLSADSATNLVFYSEAYSNAAWTKTNVTIVSTNNAGPFVESTASKIGETTANAAHEVSQSLTLADSTAYTFQAFVKAAERSWVKFRFTDKAGTAHYAFFQLSGSGTVGTTSGSPSAAITSGLPNSFYRIVIKANSSTGATTPSVAIGAATADNTASYTGTSGSGFYLQGVQCESGSTVHSYGLNGGGTSTVNGPLYRSATATTISIAGLPDGYVLNAGDRLHFDDDNSVRQYVELLEGGTASTGGAMPSALAVAPYLITGYSSGRITLAKPCAKMCLKPGTRDNSTGIIFSTHKFQAVQVLA